MSKRVIPFVLVTLFPLITHGQSVVRHGTAIFFFISEKGDYVVIAADSRQSDEHGTPLNDEECKMIVLGSKTVFFASGHVDVEEVEIKNGRKRVIGTLHSKSCCSGDLQKFAN